MPFDDISKLRDHAEYKKILKTELAKVKGTPVKFQVFDKFKFDGKVAPLMVVGKYTNDLIDDLKHGGAVFKAKGRCAEKVKDGDLEFTADQGTLPPPMLLAAMKDGSHKGEVVEKLTAGDAGKDEVLKEPQAQSEVHTGPGGTKGKAEDPKAKAEKRFTEVTRAFDGVKGKFETEERNAVRNHLEKSLQAINAKDYVAAEDWATRADAVMRHKIRDQTKSIDQTGEKVSSEAPSLAAKTQRLEREIVEAQKRIDDLAQELKDNGTQRSGEKFAVFQGRVERLKTRVAEETQKFTLKKATLAEDLKSAKGPELAELKELIGRFMALSKRSEEMSREMNTLTVGKIKDNPELNQAREDIKSGVQKMGEASQFLKAEHARGKNEPNMHGSGRHGAQTGLDRGVARAATLNEMRPDTPSNPDGVTRHLKKWNKVELTWEELPDGKKKLIDKKKIAQTVIAEVFPNGGEIPTTSMFLNPILENEAVDKALQVATRCVWKYKANNAPLLELGMVVGPPSKAPGWGYSIAKLPGIQQSSVTDTAALLDKFEKGKVTIDELCDQLDVKIKTDRTGVGALLLPYATVVLVRKTENDDWTSKTHYPDDRKNAASWELAGKSVRKTYNGPVEVAPAL